MIQTQAYVYVRAGGIETSTGHETSCSEDQTEGARVDARIEGRVRAGDGTLAVILRFSSARTAFGYTVGDDGGGGRVRALSLEAGREAQ